MMCILIHRLNMICCYNTYTPNVAVKLVNIVIRLDLKTGVFSSIFKIFLSCIRVPRLSVASNVHTHITCILCAHGHSMQCMRLRDANPSFSYILLRLPSHYAPRVYHVFFLSSFIRYIMFIGCYVFTKFPTHMAVDQVLFNHPLK